MAARRPDGFGAPAASEAFSGEGLQLEALRCQQSSSCEVTDAYRRTLEM